MSHIFGIEKQDNLIIKCLKLVIFFALALTPLVYSTKHSYFFTTPKYVFLAFTGTICFVLLVIHLFETKFFIDKKLKIGLGIAFGFIAWLLLSTIFGADFTTSFWSNFGRHTGFLTYFFSFILFIASVFIFNKETLSAPLKALTLGGTLAGLSVYLSPALFNIDLLFSNSTGYGGTFGNTTYAGIFLAFSLFSALILFFQAKIRREKWLWVLCLLLILFSPIFLNIKNIFTGNIVNILSFVGEARAGLVSVFIGLLFSVILYFYFNEKKTYTLMAKIILVIVFVGGAYVMISLFNEESKLHQAFAGRVEGVRFFYWDMAKIGIGERPILGFGLDNFSIVRDKYFNSELLSPDYPKETWVNKPHNTILEIAYSSGIPGLLLYLSLVGFALIALIRKASIASVGDKITASLFFGLFISYSFQLFFAFDTVSSLQALFVILAIVFIFCFEGTKEVGRRKFDVSTRTIALSSAVVLGLVMIYFFSFRVNQESKMVRQINTVSIQNRISRFKDTMNTSPVGVLTSESEYIDLTVDRYKKNWATFSVEIKESARKELEFLLQYSIGKSEEYPKDLRFALVTAKIANGLFGTSEIKQIAMLDLAKKYGIRAINNSPTGELGYKVMIEIYLSEGKFDTAMKFTQMLVGLNPRVPEFHNLVIYVAKIQNNQKLVDEKTENAKKFIPDYEYGMGR